MERWSWKSEAKKNLNNLVKLAPKKMVAVEPSKAIEVAKNNADAGVIAPPNIKGEDIIQKKKRLFFNRGASPHTRRR